MPRILPAVTLWQPYATLVALKIKPFETRDRRPPGRLIGADVAIHAALRKPKFGEITRAINETMIALTGNHLWFEILPFGAVVCIARLMEAVPADSVPPDPFGDYSPGRWAWKLDDVRPLRPPVPARGDRRHGWPWLVPDTVPL
jgi:hypothetical protein